MLSKFLRPACTFKGHIVNLLRAPSSFRVSLVRSASGLIPPSQYDVPIPKKLNMFYAMKVYWETIPLFVTTFASILLVVAIFLWSARNKVDVIFRTRSRENISRTMDLNYPTCHKIITINQRYEPWPEMQDVLDKMKAAEKRALSRLQTCKGMAS